MHRNKIDALHIFGESRLKRHFLDFLKKKAGSGKVRPGALTPNELKELIKSIGNKKKVNITRVEYDGTPEDKPITVQIVDIRDEYFTGKVINLERSIKQEMDEKLVFVKGGGGTVDFYYTDGDIKRVEQDIDESIIEQKNQDVLLEILDALDLEESILISFYDRNKGGVMNGTGRLIAKDVENKTFKVELNLINDIELYAPKTLDFDLEKDTILDLEVVI
jgi:hypothetical protein